MEKIEYVNVRMTKEVYNSIDKNVKCKIEIRSVFESGWDDEFKKHESYNRLKKESSRLYKELKEMEYIIRNK